jgi:hypothetical protein
VLLQTALEREGECLARVPDPLDLEIHDSQGRPLPLCTGKPVLGLF